MLDIMVVVSFCSTKKFAPEWGIFCLESLTTLGCCVCPLLVCSNIFCIFESTRRYFHSLQKNIQASLILFHLFIRIFVEDKCGKTQTIWQR